LSRLNSQLNADVRAAILYDRVFYYRIVQNWHKEFKEIKKLKNNSFMTDDINTAKDAKTALFATLLQEKGQSAVDEYLAELRAKKRFHSRSEYTKLKKELNELMQHPKGEKSDLMQELDTAVFNIAKYAR
jgi:uncharacterized membrane protein